MPRRPLEEYDASGQRWDRYGPVSPDDADWNQRDPGDEVLAALPDGRVAKVVPVTREDFLRGVAEPDEKDEPF